jgi:hypothetical protein
VPWTGLVACPGAGVPVPLAAVNCARGHLNWRKSVSKLFENVAKCRCLETTVKVKVKLPLCFD